MLEALKVILIVIGGVVSLGLMVCGFCLLLDGIIAADRKARRNDYCHRRGDRDCCR
jgi:hypothetical protein